MNPGIVTDPAVLKENGWEEFISGHPEGNVFQSPWMVDFFSAVNNFDPVVAGHLDENGRVDGILLAVVIKEMSGRLGYFSSRCVVYGGPLVTGENNQSAHCRQLSSDLISALVEMVKDRTIFIQFRNVRNMSGFLPQFAALGFNYRPRLNSIIDIDSEEAVMKRMSSARIRQIRQGLSRGAEIIEATSLEEVREFYAILRELYRKKIQKPLPGWTFFKAFFESLGAKKHGVILVVRYQGRIVGGILCPYLPSGCIYEWYVCGLDRDYNSVHPSVLATWAGIRFACRNGLRSFDFLGVGPPGKSYGVRDFKERFGGETVDYGRYARINNRFLYFLSEAGYNFLALLKKI